MKLKGSKRQRIPLMMQLNKYIYIYIINCIEVNTYLRKSVWILQNEELANNSRTLRYVTKYFYIFLVLSLKVKLLTSKTVKSNFEASISNKMKNEKQI